MSFIFDADKPNDYEHMQRRRALAEAMLGKSMQTPRNAGEGMSALANAIAGAWVNRKANRQEAEGKERASKAFERVFGAMMDGKRPTGQPIETKPLAAPREWGFDTTNVNPDALNALGGLMDAYGSDLKVNSGYRSPEHNAKVGGAKHSQHMHGNAFDVDVSGLDEAERQRLITLARQQGFGGVGVYDNALHFDIGDQRHWGPSYGRESTPDWALSAVTTPTGQMAPSAPSPQPVAAPAPPNMPSLQDLATLAGDQYLSDSQKAVAQALMQQQLGAMFPESMSPYEQARIDLQRQQHEAKLAGTGGYGRASTNVNVNNGPTGIDYGDPPKDMAWARNPDGTIRLDDRGIPIALPIINTKLANEAEKVETSAAKANETTARAADIVLEDIGRTRDLVLGKEGADGKRSEGLLDFIPETGLIGDIAEHVPGTDAHNVRALTTTIRGNIGFDRLQAMREASPTGGALGNVTIGELQRLEAVLGNLEQSQSEEQFLRNLDRLEEVYTEIYRKASAYPNAAEFGFGGGSTSQDIGPPPDGISADEWRYMSPEDRALWQN